VRTWFTINDDELPRVRFLRLQQHHSTKIAIEAPATQVDTSIPTLVLFERPCPLAAVESVVKLLDPIDVEDVVGLLDPVAVEPGGPIGDHTPYQLASQLSFDAVTVLSAVPMLVTAADVAVFGPGACAKNHMP